ncbi:MAG: hydrolase 2, exosortase A system-associated [Betaproteobacteria bacterium]
MSAGAQSRPFEPFFLPAPGGERFCVFHPAAGTPRGAVLYLHPFADEMNKSRRMAALQARSLAARGFAVLQIDLFGCGDSSGEFRDATWEIWREDVALGVQWLAQRADGDVMLWGLRLGALLALDAARHCEPGPDGIVLWQPILNGEALLTQFLRLRLASEMLAEGKSKTGVQDLRASLAAGQTLEIGGYELTRPLTTALDGLKLGNGPPPGKAVHWFEVVPEAGRALPPAAQRVVDDWTRNGASVNVQSVAGQAFWNTLEITECPALIDATTLALAEGAR